MGTRINTDYQDIKSYKVVNIGGDRFTLLKKISLILLCLGLLGICPLTTVEADLGTNLDPGLMTARIKVIVAEWPGGYGIPGVEINTFLIYIYYITFSTGYDYQGM